MNQFIFYRILALPVGFITQWTLKIEKNIYKRRPVIWNYFVFHCIWAYLSTGASTFFLHHFYKQNNFHVFQLGFLDALAHPKWRGFLTLLHSERPLAFLSATGLMIWNLSYTEKHSKMKMADLPPPESELIHLKGRVTLLEQQASVASWMRTLTFKY